MKIKKGIIQTEMDGEYLLVPTEEAADTFRGVMQLNETGIVIWKGLEAGKDADRIAAEIVDAYSGVDLETAKQCVLELIEKLKPTGLIED